MAKDRAAIRKLVLCGAATMLLLSVSFTPTSQAAEVSGNLTNIRPSGQGWYIDRPAETDELFNPGLPSGGASGAFFPENHLYVGWDGQGRKPNQIAAINFDLLQNGIAEDAKFSRFILRVNEHPQNSDRSLPNRTAGYTQGVVACAMPDFINGDAAVRLATAPSRDCSLAVRGVRATTPANPEDVETSRVFTWTFDVTSIANTLMAEKHQLSFALEPNPAAPSSETWSLSFHNGDYNEPDTATPGQNKLKPGVLADIDWTGQAADDPLSFEFADPETSFEDLSAGTSFSDSGSLTSELSPEPPAEIQATTRPVASAFRRGRAADFWDIPFGIWLLGVLSFGMLGLAGWTLQAPPVARRSPGAVHALMNGGPDETDR